MKLSGRGRAIAGVAFVCLVAAVLLSSNDPPAADIASTGADGQTKVGSNASGTTKSKAPGSATNDRVTNGASSEVIRQPEGSTTAVLPGLENPKKPTRAGRALIGQTMPKTASRRGAVVAGFPVGIVPVANGSSVQSTGLSSTATTLQVSIQAVSAKSPNAVLAFYRAKLSAIGFKEMSTPSVGGSTAAAFKHNADNLVVTAAKASTGDTEYSVFGTLHSTNS